MPTIDAPNLKLPQNSNPCIEPALASRTSEGAMGIRLSDHRPLSTVLLQSKRPKTADFQALSGQDERSMTLRLFNTLSGQLDPLVP